MKTFEERYTAWIDGQLSGESLTAFERELERRADSGDAAADTDRAGALQLRALLRDHLQAPVLTNPDFFTHQMRERIDAEIDRAARKREAAASTGWKFPALAWPFGRLMSTGAAGLFAAAALYYGLIPQHGLDAGKPLADNRGATAQTTKTAGDASVPETGALVRTINDHQYAALTTPTPAPLDDDVRVVTPATPTTTSATTLRYDKANVLWVSGLPYLPSVTDSTPAPETAPAASAVPSAAQ